jgi:hypothetical protein
VGARHIFCMNCNSAFILKFFQNSERFCKFVLCAIFLTFILIYTYLVISGYYVLSYLGFKAMQYLGYCVAVYVPDGFQPSFRCHDGKPIRPLNPPHDLRGFPLRPHRLLLRYKAQHFR